MKKFITTLMIVFVLAALLPGSAARAQTGQAAIGFEPQAIQIGTTATSEVAINIQAVQDLYAYDLTLQYDPAYLEIVDADPATTGVQVSQGRFLEGGIVVRNAVDAGTGQINYATTQVNPSLPGSGTGFLLVIRLRGIALGTTQISVTSAQLSTRDGLPIAVTSGSAAVTISNAAPSGPTPTPFEVVQPKMQYTEGTMVSVSTNTPIPEGPAAGTPEANGTLSPTEKSIRNGTPTLANTYTPTGPGKPGSMGTPVPGSEQKSTDWFSENWGMLCIVSTIIELIIAFLIVNWLRQRKNNKGRR